MGIPDGTIASSARSEGDRMFDPHRTKLVYERDAEIYCRSLPLEHFMESTTQSTQRKITLESLDLVTAVWPEFQVFSELLIQYPVPGEDPDVPARVVPDNMVIVHSDPIDAVGSFMTPLQPVGPILVLEYVSNSNKRKDNDDNRKRYERDLRVPYYLLYDSDEEDLMVFLPTRDADVQRFFDEMEDRVRPRSIAAFPGPGKFGDRSGKSLLRGIAADIVYDGGP